MKLLFLLLTFFFAPSSGFAQTHQAGPYSELFVEQLTIIIDLQNALYELTGEEEHRAAAEQFSFFRDVALNPNDYGPEQQAATRLLRRSWEDDRLMEPDNLRKDAEMVLDMAILDEAEREQREREEEFNYAPDVEALNEIIRVIADEAMSRINALDREEIAVREVALCRAKRISKLRGALLDPEKNGRTPESLKSISNMIREQGKEGVLDYIGECNP